MPWSLRRQFLRAIHRADLSKSGLGKALFFVCALFRLHVVTPADGDDILLFKMKILVLNDGIKGNFNQSLGLAGAFPGSDTEVLDVSLRGPGYRLFGRKGKSPLNSKVLALLCCARAWSLAGRLLSFFWDGYSRTEGKKADLVISAGSALAPVNMILGKNKRAGRTVNIMVPSMMPLRFFDFLIVPYHDYLRFRRNKPGNLIVTLGAPNTINMDMLSRAAGETGISKGRATVTGVVIGGDDQNYRISASYAQRISDILFSADNGNRYLFTTSRRTDAGAARYLRQRLAGEPSVLYAEFPGYSRISRYPAILGLCDRIIVTEDSINMISEAASTGLPVIIIGVERKKKKRLVFDLTIEKFVEKGYAQYIPLEKIDLLPLVIHDTRRGVGKGLRESEKCARQILENLN